MHLFKMQVLQIIDIGPTLKFAPKFTLIHIFFQLSK